jgi:hypothetical protein
MEIELRQKVKDQISGFKGLVTGRCAYISGCDQALVAPSVDKDGKLPDSQWFDVQRLIVVDAKPVSLDNTRTPGADKAAPIR